jgi:hypothetical protein
MSKFGHAPHPYYRVAAGRNSLSEKQDPAAQPLHKFRVLDTFYGLLF